MLRKIPLHRVTGRESGTGRTVWLTSHDEWTADLAAADLIEDEAIATDRLLAALSRRIEAPSVETV